MDKSENYIQGKLSAEERKAQELEMTAGDKEESAFELGVRVVFEDKVRSELRKMISSFEGRSSRSTRMPIYIGIAASVALLATFTFFLNSGKENLFDEYYKSYPNYEFTAVRGESNESVKELAYRAYDGKEYADAVNLFTQLLKESTGDVPSSFFRGMSLMELRQYENALIDFNIVIEAGNEYNEAATWYAALAQLKLENYPKAKSLLNRLFQSEEYSGKAQALKMEL
ncbi:MAG: hypothetical protein O2951_16570 [Bacteroidetes bacterium]|nr:hypothetical protein [Bacteroidota bacterium]